MSHGYTLALRWFVLGDRQAGLTNIQHGMSGIHNWLEYLNENFRFEFGQGWDPGGTIRAGIKSDLDMIASGKIDSTLSRGGASLMNKDPRLKQARQQK